MPPRVGIVLGSTSDEEKAKTAAVMLEKFGVEYELEVLSAHRDPRRVAEYGASAVDRGLQVIIAAAGKSAALPGVLAAHTTLPVIGLPIFTPQLAGQDSLFSIVQMPSGVPVAAVGLDAAANAGILAVQILAVGDPGSGSSCRSSRTSWPRACGCSHDPPVHAPRDGRHLERGDPLPAVRRGRGGGGQGQGPPRAGAGGRPGRHRGGPGPAPERVHQLDAELHHDVIAFLTAYGEGSARPPGTSTTA